MTDPQVLRDVTTLIDAIFWPTLFMGFALGVGVTVLLRLRPKKGY